MKPFFILQIRWQSGNWWYEYYQTPEAAVKNFETILERTTPAPSMRVVTARIVRMEPLDNGIGFYPHVHASLKGVFDDERNIHCN